MNSFSGSRLSEHPIACLAHSQTHVCCLRKAFQNINGFRSPHYPGFITSQGAGRHRYCSFRHSFHSIQQHSPQAQRCRSQQGKPRAVLLQPCQLNTKPACSRSQEAAQGIGALNYFRQVPMELKK